MPTVMNGDLILAEATRRLGVDLRPLVAACAVWTHPSTFEAVRRVDPWGTWFPGFRRMRKGERKGSTVDGAILDDNTRANYAIKRAVFGTHAGVENFHCCHVWPATCYDPRHHTRRPASAAPTGSPSISSRAFEQRSWIGLTLSSMAFLRAIPSSARASSSTRSATSATSSKAS